MIRLFMYGLQGHPDVQLRGLTWLVYPNSRKKQRCLSLVDPDHFCVTSQMAVEGE